MEKKEKGAKHFSLAICAARLIGYKILAKPLVKGKEIRKTDVDK